MVVLLAAASDNNSFFSALHLAEGSSSNSMVGTSVRLCHGICFHSSDQYNNCHNQPGKTAKGISPSAKISASNWGCQEG